MCWRSGKATLSNTDIEPNSAPSWKSTPILRRRASSFGHRQARDRLPLHDDVAGVGEHQPDDVLDQHALARARGAQHDRDRVVGERDVQPVEDGHAAEALVHVHAADRPVARLGVAGEVELARSGTGSRQRRSSFPSVDHVRELARLAVERERALLVARRRRQRRWRVPGRVGDFELDDLFDQALSRSFRSAGPLTDGAGFGARAGAEHRQPAGRAR